MKKKWFSTVIIILMILAGLSLLLYPTVSNYLKTIAYKNAIYGFQRSVEALDTKTYDDILAAAREYNANIASREYIMLPLSDEDQAEYFRQLNVPGTDVMGYVVIPKINAYLPIYHGTSDAVLQNGVGHLEGSSLPIGGEGAHTVLSGHRGLPSAMLFTKLDQLSEGDTFTVRVLREVLTYEVDQITTVRPDEAETLMFEPGEDYCTLVTCTPYSVNTHRLLVRGHRIPTPEEEHPSGPASDTLPMEDQNIFGLFAELFLLTACAVAAFLAVIILVCVVRRRQNRRSEQTSRSDRDSQRR